jgi:hypothetical protein
MVKKRKFTREFNLEDYDGIIVVDAGARHLIRFFEMYPELLRTRKPIISIDHHKNQYPFQSSVLTPTVGLHLFEVKLPQPQHFTFRPREACAQTCNPTP